MVLDIYNEEDLFEVWIGSSSSDSFITNGSSLVSLAHSLDTAFNNVSEAIKLLEHDGYLIVYKEKEDEDEDFE